MGFSLGCYGKTLKDNIVKFKNKIKFKKKKKGGEKKTLKEFLANTIEYLLGL